MNGSSWVPYPKNCISLENLNYAVEITLDQALYCNQAVEIKLDWDVIGSLLT